ncbi:sporulation and spore germination protein [Ruminiclostridium sufflavum DSM 19573]|uniref:Sporulation and spore germination protein n=1 Tax=Ruminiclostridium sufflavum DSM 19573 TaxID=1121337 RepID=A0A318XPS9_9FIRM|nr:GerMN domain-containing protein [Ruminiclostridium sufflavum]PYG88155.1 sporulation and spore germination protein [Ruminiclostridium sufflavum DSM 19573]
MRKLLSFILACGVIMTVFTGCTYTDNGGDTASGDELTPSGSVTMGDTEASGLKDKTPIQLYFINEQGNKLAPQTRYIDNTETSKGNAYLATVALKELIKGPDKGSQLLASIPEGTTVHSEVVIKDGVATVDLSKEFVSKHPGGKKNEQLTLYSIVNTLTEIKEIKSVQFKVEGKVKKEFKGSYQIDVAYPRSAYLISAQPAANSSDGVEAAKDNAAQQEKDDSKDKVKEDTSKDKKTTSEDKDSDDVKTNADIDEELLE